MKKFNFTSGFSSLTVSGSTIVKEKKKSWWRVTKGDMAESESAAPSPSLKHVAPPSPSPDADQGQHALQPSPSLVSVLSSERPSLRVTSEFDSESSLFLHKVSCKLLDSLAKLKFSFQNNSKGDVFEPLFSVSSKLLSLHFNLEDQNAFLKTSFDVGPRLHFDAAHDLKAQQGEVAMVAKLANAGYALELSSPVPTIGLPRATLKFPIGELTLEEKEEEEVKRALAISGVVKGQISNGLCTAQFIDKDLKLRYCYKDEAVAFIPGLSLPSNALSFAFKRRINPSNKLSYWYNFDSNNWSAVYKHTYGKDFKFKAGYDSEVRLGWASLWVGDEAGKAKSAPMKMKVQFMLQVPQDDIKSSALMFRVKKRWDI